MKENGNGGERKNQRYASSFNRKHVSSAQRDLILQVSLLKNQMKSDRSGLERKKEKETWK